MTQRIPTKSQQGDISIAELQALARKQAVLSVAETARLLRVHRSTVDEACLNGDLAFVKIGGRKLVSLWPLLERLGIPVGEDEEAADDEATAAEGNPARAGPLGR